MALDVSRFEIVQYPDPVLRMVARPIDPIDDTVRAVAARMFELMHEVEGAGLAAPQVGLAWRMFVSRADENHPERVFVNPNTPVLDGDLELRAEGCLSLPDLTVDVRRPAKATMTCLDLDGQSMTVTATGLMARIWQHEHDHLNGVLIIDKMTPMDRIANRKLLKELEAAGGQ